MKETGIQAFGLGALVLLLLAACSSTTLTSSWRDEAYTGGPPSKMLVIGVAEDAQRQRIFEDEFVRQLKARGTDALASYRLFGAEKLDREVVKDKARSSDVDAILVTRMVGSKTETVQYPGRTTVDRSPGGWHGYYRRSYEVTHRPAYTSEYQVVSLDSKLFETETESLIWSASFETVLEGLLEDAVRSFIDVALESLADEQLVQ